MVKLPGNGQLTYSDTPRLGGRLTRKWTFPESKGYHMRLLIAILALTTPAFAEQQCAGIADMLAGLSSRYGEAPRVSALMAGGDLLIGTAAPGGGWTAIGVGADDEACILAAGEAFEVKPAPIPGVDG